MNKVMKMKKCEQRVDQQLEGRLNDLRTLWNDYNNGTSDPDLGELYEYGLSFDYVAPDTFDDQREGYFRYQISWGGPSDEFRFFVNPDLSCHRVEYWFLDWFDGAHRICAGDDLSLLLELWVWFRETETASGAMKQGRR
ncbi:hypothetical protein [Rhodoplanes sp. Z2-YC6860]|uniref:hypothetical protein n=1 Tax=Rhodoplanes sp. Z2-YC6860 TaxID=674703 RepID=UPI000835CFC3|nr:hypothetical protein [Rhodoplanes sp. Z2-YC6860]